MGNIKNAQDFFMHATLFGHIRFSEVEWNMLIKCVKLVFV